MLQSVGSDAPPAREPTGGRGSIIAAAAAASATSFPPRPAALESLSAVAASPRRQHRRRQAGPRAAAVTRQAPAAFHLAECRRLTGQSACWSTSFCSGVSRPRGSPQRCLQTDPAPHSPPSRPAPAPPSLPASRMSWRSGSPPPSSAAHLWVVAGRWPAVPARRESKHAMLTARIAALEAGAVGRFGRAEPAAVAEDTVACRTAVRTRRELRHSCRPGLSVSNYCTILCRSQERF
jgi:hypothetical protein